MTSGQAHADALAAVNAQANSGNQAITVESLGKLGEPGDLRVGQPSTVDYRTGSGYAPIITVDGKSYVGSPANPNYPSQQILREERTTSQQVSPAPNQVSSQFGGGRINPYSGATVGETGKAVSNYWSNPKSVIVDIGYGVSQAAAQFPRFQGQWLVASVSNTLVPKELAKNYGLTPEEVETLYGDKKYLPGSDIISYKYLKPTAPETKELGVAGKAARSIATGILLYPAVKQFASSFESYYKTGATTGQALSSATKDIAKGFSPVQMDTSMTSMTSMRIKTGTPIEVGKSTIYSKTSYPDTGGMITQVKGEKVYKIPTKLQIVKAPTLNTPKTVETFGTLVNTQSINVKGSFLTNQQGKQFVTTGGGVRDVVTFQEIPVLATKYGVATTSRITGAKQVFSGGGTSLLTPSARVTNIIRGVPTRADVNRLGQDVVKGLTEFRTSYSPGKSKIVLGGEEPLIGLGKGEFKFRNIFTVQSTAASPSNKASLIVKTFPVGRPNVARGVTISAPTQIVADVKKLPDETGKLKEFMIQITKGESRASLFGGGRNTIGTYKTIDINKMPFELSGGGGKAYVPPSGDEGISFGSGIKSFQSSANKELFNIGATQSTMFSDITFAPSTLPSTLPKVSTRVSWLVLPRSSEKTNTITKPRVTTKENTITIVKTNTITGQIPSTATSTITSTTPITSTLAITTPITTQTTIQVPISITTPVTTTVPKLPIPKIPTLLPTSEDKFKKTSTTLLGGKKLYSVLSKRRGKWFEIAKGLPEQRAKLAGVKFTTGTLARSFRLKESGIGNVADINFRVPRDKFRVGKRDSGTYVQIKALSRGTGEVKEILTAKRIKSSRLRIL